MPHKQRLTVLLVEDSPTDAALITEELAMVEEYIFAVEHVDRLDTAIEKVGNEQFHAVLLDLQLPDSSGLATYKDLRKQAPEKPIVVLTGLDDRSVSNEALNAGADGYLVKGKCDGNRIAAAILSSMLRREQLTGNENIKGNKSQIDGSRGPLEI